MTVCNLNQCLFISSTADRHVSVYFLFLQIYLISKQQTNFLSPHTRQ
nr:MAG TPA: hypothetical protein [Bacteriophage sp.]